MPPTSKPDEQEGEEEFTVDRNNTKPKTMDSRIPVINLETIRPVIEPLLVKLTEQQWELLKTSAPDYDTKVLSAVLVSNLTTAITKLFSKFLDPHAFLSERVVQHTLGDLLTQSFGQVLAVKNQVRCANSKKLTDMIGKEIANSFNSIPDVAKWVPNPLLRYVTPPAELNMMVTLVCEMLTSLAPERTIFCKPQQKRSHTTVEDNTSVTSGQRLTGQALSQLTEPLLDNVPELEYNLLQKEAPQSRTNLAFDTWSRVTAFQAVMGWRLKTQSKIHTLKVEEDVDKYSRELNEDGGAQQAGEKRKSSVQSDVMELVFKLMRNASIVPHMLSVSTIQHLFVMTWAELRHVDIPRKTRKRVFKALYKELCQKMGSADHVLFCMILRDTKFEQLFVSSLTRHLKEQNPNRFVSRIHNLLESVFFSQQCLLV